MHVALTFLLLFVSLTASAQTDSSRPTRVFVSGHSLTDQPLPDFLDRIAASLGVPMQWERQYMVGSAIKHRARGRDTETGWAGYSMGDNRQGQGLDVVAEFRRTPYDVLVITEQHGVVDSLVWHDTVRHLRHYHDRLIDGNPKARTYFFEPWLGIPGNMEVARWVTYERTAAPVWRCISARINASLELEGRSDRITPLPASLALANLVEQATSKTGVEGVTAESVERTLARLFKDNVHLADMGNYYVALFAVGQLFGRSTVGAWAPEGITQTQAGSLQRIADESVAKFRPKAGEPSGQGCDAMLGSGFVGLYLDHMRDDYWSKYKISKVRIAWRRFKHNIKTRWHLWRQEPMGWARVADRNYWFPAP